MKCKRKKHKSEKEETQLPFLHLFYLIPFPFFIIINISFKDSVHTTYVCVWWHYSTRWRSGWTNNVFVVMKVFLRTDGCASKIFRVANYPIVSTNIFFFFLYVLFFYCIFAISLVSPSLRWYSLLCYVSSLVEMRW